MLVTSVIGPGVALSVRALLRLQAKGPNRVPGPPHSNLGRSVTLDLFVFVCGQSLLSGVWCSLA